MWRHGAWLKTLDFVIFQFATRLCVCHRSPSPLALAILIRHDKVHYCFWWCRQRHWKGGYWYEPYSPLFANPCLKLSQIASSTGLLLKMSGLKVTAIKIDPYMNVDAGTMRPTEHGERGPRMAWGSAF